MQADFSRTTFDPAKHFSAVLVQQGRVSLDADFNEQAAILLRQLRTAITDIVGPAGAPAGDNGGFEVSAVTGRKPTEDLAISAGRMYVGGVLVENDTSTTYFNQPDGFLDADDEGDQLPRSGSFVLYLRVWERLVTAAQDPSIREVALGDPGPDTAARARTVWQVAAHAVTATSATGVATQLDEFTAALKPTGQLKADAKTPAGASDQPCQLPLDSRFRGPENQLYRVEVHTGGQAWPTGARQRSGDGFLGGATFKWSRENASVVFPVVSVSGAVVQVTTLGRDGKLDLEIGDIVEIVDDAVASRVADDRPLTDPALAAPRLRTVVDIDAADRLVTLDQHDGDDDCPVGRGAVLRRWDHASTHIGTTPVERADDGAVPITEGQWIDLEDGVRVFFQAPKQAPGTYRRGDFWYIPARTAIGDVLWPRGADGTPTAKNPDGVEYHYAPLAFISGTTVDASLRHTFGPLPEPTTTAARESTRRPPNTGSVRGKPSGTK